MNNNDHGSTIPEEFPIPENELSLHAFRDAYNMASDHVEGFMGGWMIYSLNIPYVMETPNGAPIPAVFESEKLAKNICSIMRKEFTTGEQFAKLREKHSYKPNEIAHIEQITANNIETLTDALANVLYHKWFAFQYSTVTLDSNGSNEGEIAELLEDAK